MKRVLNGPEICPSISLYAWYCSASRLRSFSESASDSSWVKAICSDMRSWCPCGVYFNKSWNFVKQYNIDNILIGYKNSLARTKWTAETVEPASPSIQRTTNDRGRWSASHLKNQQTLTSASSRPWPSPSHWRSCWWSRCTHPERWSCWRHPWTRLQSSRHDPSFGCSRWGRYERGCGIGGYQERDERELTSSSRWESADYFLPKAFYNPTDRHRKAIREIAQMFINKVLTLTRRCNDET